MVDATGALITGFGSGVGMTTPSRQVTILGGSVAPGVYTLSFTAIKLQLDPLTFLAVPGSPILETCTAALTVVAR